MNKNYTIYDPCKEEIAKLISSVSNNQISYNEIYEVISTPPKAEMGDYAAPLFKFAKELKRNPNELCSEIALACQKSLSTSNNSNPWISACSALGAFLNFNIKTNALANYLFPKLTQQQLFSDLKYKSKHNLQKTMIEFSQPNTHKNFHIGHVRNVCLGDSLTRMFKYCGFDITPVNYIGDEGTHIAECLWYIQKHKLKEPSENRVIWLEQAYSSAKQLLANANEQEKVQIQAEITKVHHELEEKKGFSYEQWVITREWCMQAFKEIYQWLDVDFDHYFFESEMTEESQTIVEEYLKKGVLKLDQGAVGIDLSDYKLGFAIYRKSNGATLYATKDLALARRKFENYDIERSIYVVANEQNLHFQQVFKTLELMGFEQAKNCYHLSYAMVKLPDGKMSTRKGNAVHFTILRETMVEKLISHMSKYKDEWSTDEINDSAKKLAVAAIKYGMLAMDPNKEIVFNMDDWLSFEGNTGPYLLYSLTRAKSILKKSKEQKFSILCDNYQNLPNELNILLKYFYDFNEVVAQATEQYKPSSLCNHLYYMCKEFNRFYANTHILNSDNKSELLAVVSAFEQAMEQGLALIGIQSIARM